MDYQQRQDIIVQHLGLMDEHHVAKEPVSGYVTRDGWSEICESVLEQEDYSEKDLAALMAMCAMLMLDSANVVVMPPHLHLASQQILRVRKDPVALSRLSVAFAQQVRSRYGKRLHA